MSGQPQQQPHEAVTATRVLYASVRTLSSKKLFTFLLVGLFFGGKTVYGAETPEQEQLGLSMLMWSGIAYIAAQGVVDACEKIAEGMKGRGTP